MLFQDSYEQEHLLNEFTSKFHMERSKAEEVRNVNVVAVEFKIALQILHFLRSGHHCGDVDEVVGNEASLTWLDVKPVNRQVPTFSSIFTHKKNIFLTDCIESGQLWESLWRTKPSEPGGG